MLPALRAYRQFDFRGRSLSGSKNHFTLTHVSESAITIRSVHSRADHRRFCEFPYHLYRDDPDWIPPLRRTERARWQPRRNPSLETRYVTRFLATVAQHTVGRIAAIIDPVFEQRWSPHTGFFGFFECVPNPDVASALLDTVVCDLRARGKKECLGPVNLTTHDEVGVRVHGAGPPTVLSPYNPPGYSDLLTVAGFVPFRTYHAYRWRPETAAAESVQRLLRRLRRGESLTVRAVNPKRWNDEVCILHDLYNRCFTEVWGFVPLSENEFRVRAAAFRSFLQPELIRIAEDGDAPVGFCVVLPDINVLLRPLHGRLLPFGWMRLALSARRIRTARFVLLGVLPKYVGRGVAVLIVHEAIQAAHRLGLQEVELSLILEENERVRHVVRAFGGQPVKTYQLFRKTWDDGDAPACHASPATAAFAGSSFGAP